MTIEEIIETFSHMSFEERARILGAIVQTMRPHSPDMMRQASWVHNVLTPDAREMLFVLSVQAGVTYTFPNTDQPPFIFARPHRQEGQHPLDVWITHILVNSDTYERETLSVDEIFNHRVEVEKHPGTLVGIEAVTLFSGQSELSARLLIYAGVVIGLPHIPQKAWMPLEEYDRIQQVLHPDAPAGILWLAAKAASESPV